MKREVTSYIEVGNKAQLMSALRAVPYNPGELTEVVLQRRNGGATTYRIGPHDKEDQWAFDRRLASMVGRVRRCRAGDFR